MLKIKNINEAEKIAKRLFGTSSLDYMREDENKYVWQRKIVSWIELKNMN